VLAIADPASRFFSLTHARAPATGTHCSVSEARTHREWVV
jgi:hypothetical protein